MVRFLWDFIFFQWIIPQFSVDPSAQRWGLFWYYVAIGILFNGSTVVIYGTPQNSLRITTNAPPSTAFRFAFDWWKHPVFDFGAVIFKGH